MYYPPVSQVFRRTCVQGGDSKVVLNHPELTQTALGILRNPSTFQWYFIPLLAGAVYVYFAEITRCRLA